jgi:hypothetical protein
MNIKHSKQKSVSWKATVDQLPEKFINFRGIWLHCGQ